MQRLLPQTLAALLMGVSLIIPPALAQVYRCVDASGHTTYSQRPCRGGIDTGIPTDGYSTPRQTWQEQRQSQGLREQNPAPQSRRQTQSSSQTGSRVPSDYASQSTLANRCGRLHDGVNATHRPALEHTLQRLLDTGRVIELSANERKSIRELQCRVDRLRVTEGLEPLYGR